jgi:hypothetical protein
MVYSLFPPFSLGGRRKEEGMEEGNGGEIVLGTRTR